METSTQAKKVTVFSTLGNNTHEISTNASTYGEFKKSLESRGVDYSGMKATVGETQVTLESPDAMLPEGDFTLFLMPMKVNSGYGV
jgi:hypothetical protein